MASDIADNNDQNEIFDFTNLQIKEVNEKNLWRINNEPKKLLPQQQLYTIDRHFKQTNKGNFRLINIRSIRYSKYTAGIKNVIYFKIK